MSGELVPRSERVEKALETLTKGKLEPGTLVPVKDLENLLGIGRNTQAFGFMVSEIRHRLFSNGKYLSGEGLEAKQAFEILHPRDHHWMARLAMLGVDRKMEGMDELLSNTNISSLTSLEKSRHENAAREVALKMRVLGRISKKSDLGKISRSKA